MMHLKRVADRGIAKTVAVVAGVLVAYAATVAVMLWD
jgi:hypothetical protein